jgi:hypothetical protein
MNWYYQQPEPTMVTDRDRPSFARPSDNPNLLSDQAFTLAMENRRTNAMTNSPTTLNDYGSIKSMDLPGNLVADNSASDAGYLNLGEGDPRNFKSKTDQSTTLGIWNTTLPRGEVDKARDILKKPPHDLTDDEYFKVSGLMPPGPWSGDGRNHEISLRLDEINGKKALVYDYWRAKDLSQDGPFAKPGPNDLRGRVVFVPNDATGKVDVLYLRTSQREFTAASAEFKKSLDSIKWN